MELLYQLSYIGFAVRSFSEGGRHADTSTLMRAAKISVIVQRL